MGMMKAILSATASNQKLMKESIKAFKKCKTTMWRNYGRALPYEKRYWQLKTIYPKCKSRKILEPQPHQSLESVQESQKHVHQLQKTPQDCRTQMCQCLHQPKK